MNFIVLYFQDNDYNIFTHYMFPSYIFAKQMGINNKYNYYLVPGLGFNEKTFKHLELYSAASVNIINWLEPNGEEPLEDYIKRMAESIDPNLPHKIFIGHSFGGVMVQEFSQFIQAEKVFLVSSIKHRREMSWNLNILRKVPLYRIINHSLINNTFDLWAKMHDFHNEEEKEAFIEMVNDMSMDYFKWAVHAILNWTGIKNRKIDPIHLHGTNDMTFPYRKIKKPITLKGAGHFMIFNRAKEVSEIIKKELEASDVPIFNS